MDLPFSPPQAPLQRNCSLLLPQTLRASHTASRAAHSNVVFRPALEFPATLLLKPAKSLPMILGEPVNYVLRKLPHRMRLSWPEAPDKSDYPPRPAHLHQPRPRRRPYPWPKSVTQLGTRT